MRNPDKEALRWKLPKTKRMAEGPAEEEAVAWTSTTYRQTWDWITQVAMGLKHLGIRDGDRICIMSRTRPAWLAADLGSLSLGVVTCPIYPSVEPMQAAYVINNVGARLIFVENLQQAAKIDQVRAECPTLEHVVVIDDRGRLPGARSASTTSSTWPRRTPARSASGRRRGRATGATGWPPSCTPPERPPIPRAWS